MHLIRRVGLAVAILALVPAVGSAAGKTGILWDAGSVGGRDIFSARGNGKKVRLRTANADGDAALLFVSPAGKRVAWLLTPPGTTGTNDLVVAKAAKGRGRTVTETLEGRVLDAAFTGNGKHLLFVFEDAATGRADLYRVNAKGKGLRSPTLGLPGNATEIITTSADGAEAVVEWDFPDRRGLLRVDVRRNVATVLDTALPDGEPGGYAWFPAPGVLHFTWRADGADRDDLYTLDDVALTPAVEGIDFARATPGGTDVVVGHELVRVSPSGISRRRAPGTILGLARGLSLHPPVAAVEDDGEIRVLELLGDPANHIDLLPGRVISEVEEMTVLPDRISVLLTVREGSIRRLFWTRSFEGVPFTVDLAEGLVGTVGAFRTVMPDGTVIFAHVAEHGSLGELYAWRLSSQRIALIERTGLIGLPGRAVVSGKTGDVLFNVITMPDADNRLFLWNRKKDEVKPLSSPATRPGTFLFTR